MKRAAMVVWAALSASCGGEATISAVARGAEVVKDPKLSISQFNSLACTDCHATSAEDGRILAGFTLLGAAARPSFWGGGEPDLKSAVDACLVFFMKGDPLDRTDPEARALYEYLGSLEDLGPREALPLTVVRDTTVVPARGDAARGAQVHQLACARCHGPAHTGDGRIERALILPDEAARDAAAMFPSFPPAAVFVEKVRHGRFFGVNGNMPPFALEAMSDADLGALLAFYGL